MRRFRIALAFASLLLPSVAQAQSNTVTPYEFYATPIWTMYQQYWQHAYDACIANKNELDGGTRLTIGRSISGDDFIMVHNMKSLIGEAETEIAGKVWINGKTPYDFSGVKPFDSVSTDGEKYVTIYLANGFIDQFAKANSVDVEFSKGRSKHSLRGSRDVIERLNTCADAGLARELEAPPPPPPPLRTPLNWTAGASPDGKRYMAIKMAATPTQPAVHFAYAESSPGRFDIRIRQDEGQLPNRVDSAAPETKRYAVNVIVNGAPAFATLAMHNGTNADIVDISAADLMKLAVVGDLEVKSFDASQNQSVTFKLSPDASFGPGAITAAPAAVAPVAGAPTLEGLVGKYFVRGKNPNGQYYYGSAETLMEGATLRINWTWTNGKTDTGVANMLQNVLTAVVPGLSSPAIYTIGKDGTWRGTWDNGKATEVMVPKL